MLCSVAQSCLTLCNPVACIPPGSSVHGILQARILEWVAMPPPGDLPNPGIEPGSPPLPMDSLLFKPPGRPCIGTKKPQKSHGQSCGVGLAAVAWNRTGGLPVCAKMLLPTRSFLHRFLQSDSPALYKRMLPTAGEG